MPRWLVRIVLRLGDFHRRMLGFYFALLGPRLAYALTGMLGRLVYRLLPELQQRCVGQCRAALAGRVDPADVPRIAAQSWLHRVWGLTDLVLAERLLHSRTYARYGGCIPEPHRSDLLAAQRRGQPAILLTAYYGPFDLLPVFLGFNGIRAAAVYRPHENPGYDAYRRRVRARSGCELVPIEQAITRLPQVLDAGGSIAVVADHHMERRGLPVTFLGLPTMAVRTVGILAARHRADVVVAGIRRIGPTFRFEIVIIDVAKYPIWADEPDPVTYITQRYLRGLERLVLLDPTQYSWAHARWGEDLARQLAAGASQVSAELPPAPRAIPPGG